MATLTDQFLHFATILTEFSLKEASNKDGLKYMRSNFKMKSPISAKDRKVVKKFRDDYKKIFRFQEITADDIKTKDTSDTKPTPSGQTSQDDVPF